jgi:glyoxylase-like metal-dependent hydrolase (beta-lactamase superfamily II)
MIEEVAKSIYRIEIPLPNNPLKSINSYIIKNKSRNLIVDSGMNLRECREAFSQALTKLGIDLEKSDFFITHFHVDHLELATFLATGNTNLYLNQIESNILNSPVKWEAYLTFYIKHGLPEGELQQMEGSNLTHGYLSGRFARDYKPVNNNDVLQIGEYAFQCIITPGHTPGHTCLYEAEKKILLSGDHILFDITPNITSWLFMENPLKEYLAYLDKIYPLEVKLVLPGHRNIDNNHRKRIIELKEHHKIRANEIRIALGSQWKSAYEIAPKVTWDVSFSAWDQFPASQKFFAMGEVVAHLRYLEEEGLIISKTVNGRFLFSNNAD